MQFFGVVASLHGCPSNNQPMLHPFTRYAQQPNGAANHANHAAEDTPRSYGWTVHGGWCYHFHGVLGRYSFVSTITNTNTNTINSLHVVDIQEEAKTID